jgi:5-methylcytosine-specific restriction endonuclease McrA
MPKCSSCSGDVTRAGRCSACNVVYMRDYRAANLDTVRAGQRDHYARNSEKVKAASKAYAEANPLETKRRKARRYDLTKLARRAKIKEWQQLNPERYRELMRIGCLNRVARKRNAEGRYTVADIRKLYDAQNGICVACLVSLLNGYHVDHIEPLSKGGSNWPSNLQLLCPPCNMQKAAQSMNEFLERRKTNATRA